MPGSFVDGAIVDLPGDELEVVDPADGSVVDVVADVGSDGVDVAVAAASTAFPGWWATPAAERGAIVRAGARAILDHVDELAPLLTSEQGKPLRESRLELRRAAETLEHYAGLALAIRGAAVSDLDRGVRGMVMTRPLGVVGAIVPWNFPTTLLCNKLGPALVTGNTVVAKPDETTPLTTLRLAELLHEAGLPAGVVGVVTGRGDTTGEAMLVHRDIRKLAFTGSTPIGKHVMQRAAGSMKRVTLELGGSDPLIVLDDADVDAAISAASMGRFFNCGQACLAIKRVYASESIAERVAEGIAAKAGTLVLGPGAADGTQVGPMHGAEGRDQLEAQVADAIARGGEVLAGGGRPAGDQFADGFFHEPTVVWNPDHESRVSVEETFGPALPVWPVADLDEAIARSNASRFGLGSSVWTADLASAMRAAEQLDAGYTWINSRTKVYDELPFGGLKESGYGKEHGDEALSFYTEQKSIVIRT